MARTDTVHQRSRWALIVKAPLACALIAGASCSVTLLSPSAPAGANQISSLQAQAAQISSEMLLEQLQIAGYQQQYTAAVVQSQQDEQRVMQAQAHIQRDQDRIDQDTRELKRAAVQAYVSGGTASGVTPLFTDAGSDGAQAEYQVTLIGSVSVAADQLHSDRRALQAQEASLQQIEGQDQVELDKAATVLQQSQSTQQQLEALSAQVNGQLATAVAEQQAQQAAAAAAAVRAAQASAISAQQDQLVVDRSSSAAGASTGSPSLNPFLQCVVQQESSGNYQAVSPSGEYMGAFQFSQSTWNQAAQMAGLSNLVGVPPDQASPAEQDTLAIALYSADGSQPWYDPCSAG